MQLIWDCPPTPHAGWITLDLFHHRGGNSLSSLEWTLIQDMDVHSKSAMFLPHGRGSWRPYSPSPVQCFWPRNSFYKIMHWVHKVQWCYQASRLGSNGAALIWWQKGLVKIHLWYKLQAGKLVELGESSKRCMMCSEQQNTMFPWLEHTVPRNKEWKWEVTTSAKCCLSIPMTLLL